MDSSRTVKFTAVWLCLFVCTAPLVFPAGAVKNDGCNVKISEVYYATGPGCDYIVLENRGEEVFLSQASITDGEGSLHLPNVTLKEDQRLVIAENEEYEDIWMEDPDLLWTDKGQVEKEGQFTLAKTGDEVIFEVENEVVDAFYYGEGSEDIQGEWSGRRAEVLTYGTYAKRNSQDTNTERDWNWSRGWNVGHSDFEPEEFSFHGKTEVYASPDSSYSSVCGYLGSVEEELLIAVYELKNVRIARKIANLSKEGIQVKVLVEGHPVGGVTERERHCLFLIEEAGGVVASIGEDRYSPYSYVHSKYMLADGDSVLITSENLGCSGHSPEPSNGNRGWGIAIWNELLYDYYKNVFEWDWEFHENIKTENYSLEPKSVSVGDYKPRFEPRIIEDRLTVRPVLSPDTSYSKGTILDMINSAEDSIYVQQFYIDRWDHRENPYLDAIKEAAEGGVVVKILLDATWYNIEDNDYDNDDVVRELNELANMTEIDLEARLINKEHGFLKQHNKGMIVDEEKVLISSINWNQNSILQNREVGIIVENEGVGDYFTDIFKEDWRDDCTRPIADAGKDRTLNIAVEDRIELSGEFSWDNGGIQTYRWDLDDDGIYDKEGEVIDFSSERRGNHTVRLYVEDKSGLNDSDYVTIRVIDRPGGNTPEERDGDLLFIVLPLFLVVPIGVLWYRKKK